MGRTFDRGVLVGAGLLSAMLIGGAILTYQNARRLRDDTRIVVHTLEVLDLANGLMLTLLDAETGQRGFLLSGDDAFLRPHDDAPARLDDKWAELKFETRDNDRQQARLEELRGMIAGRLALLKVGVALHRGGGGTPALAANTRRGQRSMDGIRRLVAEFVQEERDLLGGRERRSGATFRAVMTTGLITTLFGLAVVGSSAWFFGRHLLFRQRDAKRARDSERRYRALVNSTPQVVWAVGGADEGAKAWWSELTGQTPEESAGLNWLGAVHPEDRERIRATWAHAFETHALYDTEYRIRTRAGEYRHFVVRGVALPDPDGGEPEWIGTLTDVTEKKRHEEQLEANERQYATLAAAVPGFLFSNRADGWSDYTSPRFYEYTGLPDGAANGFGWAEAVHPDDRDGATAHFAACLRERKLFEREFRFRSACGDYRWFLARSAPLLDEQGRIAKWYGICTDIEDQKQAESALRELNATLEQRVDERTRALREQEERFRIAFDHAPIGIALVAPDGTWLQVNNSLCEIVGYTEAELRATDFRSITHPDDLALNLDNYRGMLAGTIRTYQTEKRYLHKKGHFVYTALSVSLVRGGDGEPLYFITQVKDITQRKYAEEHLKASLREKEVLLKEIHHRVKNNLQIVSTLLDLQSDHTQDRQAVQMFEESRGRVKSMALIHERLYSSQDLSRVDFAEYISQLADDLYHSYKVSGDEIALEVDVDVPPLPIDIAIPCGLLLNELMSNCLKHAFRDASEGRIRVSLRDDGVGRIALTVADDGAGFPPGLDFRATTSFGMQLVNTLVEQLDGVVELTTARGTEFTVRFSHTG